MKFSVLLPTRNRLSLLKYAIETVMRQDYDDWEVIVSDNDSDEDICGYVRELRDPRVRCVRTQRFVPVTDNWNHALAQSTGDYVVMLGDDDCLLQGYFRRMKDLIEEHAFPDFLFCDAIQFAYPGVIPGYSKGFIQIAYAAFFKGAKRPFLLARDDAKSLVRASMNLRLTFGFNMQHSLISRRMIERLSSAHSFFQSSYPDYYASNALLLEAERILIVPQPLVVIGISPKSFGYFYFNNRQDEGIAFLNNMNLDDVPEQTKQCLLPGNDLFTAWFLAMHKLESDFAAQRGLSANRRRYRTLQVLFLCKQLGWGARHKLWKHLSAKEKLAFGPWFFLLRLMPRSFARFLSWVVFQLVSPYPLFDSRRRIVDFENIVQLFETTPAAYY